MRQQIKAEIFFMRQQIKAEIFGLNISEIKQAA